MNKWEEALKEGGGRGPFADCSFHSPLDQGVLGIDRPHSTSTRLASETNHIPNNLIDKREELRYPEPCHRWSIPWYQLLDYCLGALSPINSFRGLLRAS